MNIRYQDYQDQDKLLPFKLWRLSRVKKDNPLWLRSIQCSNEEGVLIGPDVRMGENVLLHSGVQIRGKCWIGPNTTMDSYSIIEDSIIGDNSTVGPHALIQHSSIGKNSHIGFTAQIKRSNLGMNTNANHHCYVGDTDGGDHINFSAGSITGNYDGVKKWKTLIGEGVMVGINANIVAPRTIGTSAFIGAGSLIKEDVPPHSLVLPIINMYTSANKFPQHTDRGYELFRLGAARIALLKEIFGVSLEHFLCSKHPLTGGGPLITLLQTNQLAEFDKQILLIKQTQAA
ncbi:MAG: hypothetical protein HYT37_00450 [Candidatus Sungbacteria bacterium]|nr:hypothetical protein [Candidatus Sungbacteria bacterium]